MKEHFFTALGAKRRWIFALLASFCLAGTLVSAQETAEPPVSTNAVSEGSEFDQYSASGLLTKAMSFLADQLYIEAVPLLKEYVERMESNPDERVQSMLQEVRLKLAQVMIYLEMPEDALTYLEQYTSHSPKQKWRTAYKLYATSLYEVDRYEECISAVTNGLAGPPPEEQEVEKKVDYEQLSEDELGGLTARQLRRYEKDAETADNEAFANISVEDEDEPEYTPEELVELNLLLAESYAGLSKWKKSVEPYKYVVENETDADRRGYAIMQLVSALIAQSEFDAATEFVLELYRTNARYNIRVNMALMSAASALLNSGEYDSALPLYRMILPRQELLDYQTQKMNEIRRAEGMSDVKVTVVTNSSGRVQTLFGSANATWEEGASSGSSMGSRIGKPEELIDLEDRVATLMSLPPYETDVMFRMGELYAEAGRPWEALSLLNRVQNLDPSSPMGQQAFYQILQVLMESLHDYAQAEERGLAYLDGHKEGIAPRQIAYLLSGMYQRQNMMQKIKTLLPYINSFEPTDDFVAKQYETELWYMQAVADLVLLNYEKAEAGFRKVLTEFPESHQEDNAFYWHAMTLLFLQKYEEAFADFEKYPEKFLRGSWLDVSAFRGGICLFAMERYQEAKERFTYVIETWPESSIFPDACSLRGDLLGSQGLLDEAVADYRTAIATARKPEQATYAVFQMASVFEAEEKYDLIIDEVNAYMDRYGEDADIAKSMYWIGKTKLQQGLVNEAIDAYFNTVVRFGHDIRQDGVDLILAELVQVASRRLEDDEIASLEARIENAIAETDSETLRLRLRVLRAQLHEEEIELGRELLAESVDLEQAPPPVLAVICEASFASENYSKAPEMLKIFQLRYEDSEYVRSAYKLAAFNYYTSEEYDKAFDIVEEAQANFGADYDMAWAQLMKGKILLRRQKLDEARDAFMGVLNVRDWRGEPYAEATYYLGEVEEKSGNPRKAFGWYQRAYFQYKGHANGYWAAEAYLASARCLQTLGMENDRRNTYRAMLFDKYVNQLPQADVARDALGAEETEEINQLIALGIHTNLAVTIEAEVN